MNQNGHLEIVELLLAKGANIDQVDHTGQTPLWIAAYVWIYCCFSSYRICVCVCFFVCIQKFKSNITPRKIVTKLSSSCWRRVPTLIEKMKTNSLLLAQLVKYALLLFWCLNKFVEINFQIKNSEDT